MTGAYPLLGYAYGVDVPHGVQLCDGPDECRKAVREQISYGSDWIKVYVDRGYFLRPDGVLDDIPTFTLCHFQWPALEARFTKSASSNLENWPTSSPYLATHWIRSRLSKRSTLL